MNQKEITDEYVNAVNKIETILKFDKTVYPNATAFIHQLLKLSKDNHFQVLTKDGSSLADAIEG
ncbi:hypothetical protein H9X96_01110 [Pedobacter sp. N36a]|uniref:hypothetical protein n=1 Tax=unclassified Pedobacter TaxID=2628915 RepID=UPI000706756D|nr:MULTISPECIES: hypothetical protein [unclassified Pedobacter]ALL07350.1 hypothetical protein AQ505_18770 [Pedobacter sp. PACM 27299]MBC8984368.1 hypothetical protein [Pedobacter sp. N36a]